jgi:hypothetical protein
MSGLKLFVPVEGTSDDAFFTELFKRIFPTLAVEVKIDPSNTRKKSVLDNIKSDLNLLERNTNTSFLYIVDADKADNKDNGFQGTLAVFQKKLGEKGYQLDPNTQQQDSLIIFNNPDLLPIALWIMPNNAADGMFEDWIADCIDQDAMFLQAKSAVGAIQNPVFSTVQKPKADVYTWLAWQKRPALSLVYALQKNLITSSPTFQNFEHELKQFIQRLEHEAAQESPQT